MQIKNPVMFVVYIGAIFTTALYLLAFAGIKDEAARYTLAIALILWFTVLFQTLPKRLRKAGGARRRTACGKRVKMSKQRS